MILEDGWAKGIPYMERARELADVLDHKCAVWWFDHNLFYFYLWQPRPDVMAADRAFGRAREVAAVSRSPTIRRQTCAMRAVHLWHHGRLREALAVLEEYDIPNVVFAVIADSIILYTGDDDNGIRLRMTATTLPTTTYIGGGSSYFDWLHFAVANRGWRDVVPDPSVLIVAVCPEHRRWLSESWPRLDALTSREPDLCAAAAAELDAYIGMQELNGLIRFRLYDHRIAASLHAFAGNRDRAVEILEADIPRNRACNYPGELAYELRDNALIHLAVYPFERSVADGPRHPDKRRRTIEAFREAHAIACRCSLRPLSEQCTELLLTLGEAVEDHVPSDVADGPLDAAVASCHHPPADTAVTPLPDGLTHREAEVFALLVEGLTNAEIGERLFISPRTVANHVQSILNKTGSGNRAEAGAYAIRNGIAWNAVVAYRCRRSAMLHRPCRHRQQRQRTTTHHSLRSETPPSV